MRNYFESKVVLTYFGNVCYYSVDHRTRKSVPVEEGKIFVKVRGWKAGDEYPTYEDLETFLYFLDKYAFQNLGSHAFAKFMRNNPNKTLVDKLTSQDIAYAVLIYEDRMDVWEEGLRKDEDGFVCTAKQKYHFEEGVKLPKYSNGWTETGRAYFQELCGQFSALLKNEKYFEALSEYW